MSPVPGVVAQRFEAAVPLDRLELHPGNANVGDLDLLAELLDANGFAGAVMAQASTGIVFDGNHRLLTARARGMPSLPVIWCDIDDDARDRFLASFNESARRGHNDEGKLVALLTGLAASPRGLAGAAYTAADLARMVAGMNGSGPEPEVAGPPAEPVTRAGDLWLLGPHRLLCGDATNPADIGRVLDGLGEPGIVFADPPYGIAAVPSDGGASRYRRDSRVNGGRVKMRAPQRPIVSDDTPDVAAAAFRLLTARFPGAMHVWWGANHYAQAAGVPDASCWLVWDKETSTSDFADAELAWTNHPGPVRLLRHMWNGVCRASEAGEPTSAARKPVALAEWVYGVTDPKHRRAVVLDPFAGAGASLLAADRSGRAAALIEIDPVNCDLICRRWEEQTGGSRRLSAGEAGHHGVPPR